MFEGFDLRVLPFAFLIPFLLVFVPLNDTGWPLSATAFAALVPAPLGLAFLAHRVRRHVITVSLVFLAAAMQICAGLIVTGSLSPLVPA